MWNDLPWQCLFLGHADLRIDLQMLDFWLSLSSRTELSLTYKAMITYPADLPLSYWRFPYVHVLAAHQHRIKHLAVYFENWSYVEFLTCLPLLSEMQSLELGILGAASLDANVMEVIAPPPTTSALFRGLSDMQNFPCLRDLYLKNFAFDVPILLGGFERIEHLELRYDAEFLVEFDTRWLATALASCGALKELVIGLEIPDVVADSGSAALIFNAMSGRSLQKLVVRAPTGSAAILGCLQHHLHRVLKVAWNDDAPDYFHLAGVRDATALRLTEHLDDPDELDIELQDERGFVRIVSCVRHPPDAGGTIDSSGSTSALLTCAPFTSITITGSPSSKGYTCPS